jgi:hypothetical protein
MPSMISQLRQLADAPRASPKGTEHQAADATEAVEADLDGDQEPNRRTRPKPQINEG